MGEREAEHQLCMQVSGRACTTPSPHGLAAVAALRRVAPVAEITMLAEAFDTLAQTQPLPPWYPAEPDWTPVAARRAVDMWDAARGGEERPTPITKQPVADVLADIADALRIIDITWPRNDDDDYVNNRPVAWSR